MVMKANASSIARVLRSVAISSGHTILTKISSTVFLKTFGQTLVARPMPKCDLVKDKNNLALLYTFLKS